MAAFRPNVAILPGHSEQPGYDELLPYATLLEQQGAIAIVPEMPNGAAEEIGTWGRDSFLWPLQITALDELHQRMNGAHALLFVNGATESAFLGRDYEKNGIIHHSMSNVMVAAALGAIRSDVPVALTNQPEWNNWDNGNNALAFRLNNIQELGATIVGHDLAGMPDFLAERANPGHTIHGSQRPRQSAFIGEGNPI